MNIDLKNLKEKVLLMSELNKSLYESHEYEMLFSHQNLVRANTMENSERNELLDYLKNSRKSHKSPQNFETPLLDIYMKSLRLQEYQGRTSKYDLSQPKKLNTQNSLKVSGGAFLQSPVAHKSNFKNRI